MSELIPPIVPIPDRLRVLGNHKRRRQNQEAALSPEQSTNAVAQPQTFPKKPEYQSSAPPEGAMAFSNSLAFEALMSARSEHVQSRAAAFVSSLRAPAPAHKFDNQNSLNKFA